LPSPSKTASAFSSSVFSRRILPDSCFSIEPGIYLPELGVRTEVNVLVRSKTAEVTGKIQREIVII